MREKLFALSLGFVALIMVTQAHAAPEVVQIYAVQSGP